jgi:hypothetical protein
MSKHCQSQAVPLLLKNSVGNFWYLVLILVLLLNCGTRHTHTVKESRRIQYMIDPKLCSPLKIIYTPRSHDIPLFTPKARFLSLFFYLLSSIFSFPWGGRGEHFQNIHSCRMEFSIGFWKEWRIYLQLVWQKHKCRINRNNDAKLYYMYCRYARRIYRTVSKYWRNLNDEI